ncbi:unnamed protein product [Boreogadus saida]
MVTISEPDPGIYEDPDDKSLDREETRKRRFDLCLPITLIVSLGLLIILTISLRLSSLMPLQGYYLGSQCTICNLALTRRGVGVWP